MIRGRDDLPALLFPPGFGRSLGDHEVGDAVHQLMALADLVQATADPGDVDEHGYPFIAAACGRFSRVANHQQVTSSPTPVVVNTAW